MCYDIRTYIMLLYTMLCALKKYYFVFCASCLPESTASINRSAPLEVPQQPPREALFVVVIVAVTMGTEGYMMLYIHIFIC